MAVYVNIKGSNASRKSTKIDCLLKYLLSKGASEEIVEGGCEIDKINELASEKIYGIVFVEEG